MIELVSRSLVKCVEQHDAVLVAPVLLHEVRRYDADGSLRWWAELGGLDAIDLVEHPDGRTSAGIPEDGYHGAVGLASDERGALGVVQMGFVTRESRREGGLEQVLTYVFSVQTGEAAYSGLSVPRAHAFRDQMALFSEPIPYPTVIVMGPEQSP
ncbi:MAG: hypothetical protein MJB57_18680 [Gemmatimonadetes bacterium]|nr:hypothetical protein [Gemmatimonadota bacterium]